MKKIFGLLLVIVITISLSGCTDSGPVTVTYNATSDSSNFTITQIEEKGGISPSTLITGRVIEIRFVKNGFDTIVFEDNYVISKQGAESEIWKLGEIHQIKIAGSQIKSVTIIEDSDKK